MNVSLYVTKAASSSATTAESSDAEKDRHAVTDSDRNGALERVDSAAASDPEKNAHHHRLDIFKGNSGHSLRADVEKKDLPATRQERRNSTSTDNSQHRGHEVRVGRPDTATIIREVVSSTPASGRVLIAACGPDGLMKVVRNTTASLIRGDGPGVELHCEQFGW